MSLWLKGRLLSLGAKPSSFTAGCRCGSTCATMTVLAFVPSRVLFGEFVAVYAMRFCFLNLPICPDNIFGGIDCRRNNSQVIDIAARPIAALMINKHSFGDRADFLLPRIAMDCHTSQPCGVAAFRNHAVTFTRQPPAIHMARRP